VDDCQSTPGHNAIAINLNRSEKMENDKADLRKEIEKAINTASAENGSNTPDFILAEYLISCLTAFDKAILARTKWHDFEKRSNSIFS
jgi:hypothetical protein